MNLRPRVFPKFDEGDCETLLALLNGELARDSKRWAAFWSVSPARVRAKFSAYRKATTEVQRLVAGPVDEWLDSGRRSDGSEAPEERCVKPLTTASLAVTHYCVTARVTPTFAKGIPFVQLSSWFRTGEDEVSDKVLRAYNPRAHAAHESRRIFTMLLLSEDWRFRLAKCRKCSTYFLLSRHRETYRNGCFCSVAHNRSASATKRMEGKRNECRQKQIEWAATELLKLRKNNLSCYDDTQLKDKLVTAVNRQLHKNRIQEIIAVNWITHRKSEIEKKANEMSRANS